MTAARAGEVDGDARSGRRVAEAGALPHLPGASAAAAASSASSRGGDTSSFQDGDGVARPAFLRARAAASPRRSDSSCARSPGCGAARGAAPGAGAGGDRRAGWRPSSAEGSGSWVGARRPATGGGRQLRRRAAPARGARRLQREERRCRWSTLHTTAGNCSGHGSAAQQHGAAADEATAVASGSFLLPARMKPSRMSFIRLISRTPVASGSVEDGIPDSAAAIFLPPSAKGSVPDALPDSAADSLIVASSNGVVVLPPPCGGAVPPPGGAVGGRGPRLLRVRRLAGGQRQQQLPDHAGAQRRAAVRHRHAGPPRDGAVQQRQEPTRHHQRAPRVGAPAAVPEPGAGRREDAGGRQRHRWASAGVGILNDTGIQFANIIHISKQLLYFAQYQKRLSSLIGAERTARLVSGALVLITLGGNDFVNNYYLVPYSVRSREFSLPDFISYLLSQYRQVLRTCRLKFKD